jgi:hypothetical protein
MERCKERHDLFFRSIFQMEEHRTGWPREQLFGKRNFLAEHSHEIATIVHHDLVAFRSPQNFFRGFVEDGNLKPVQHRTHVLLARAVAVRFDINVSRIIIIADRRMRIVLSRIILPRILSWILPRILIALPRILSWSLIIPAGVRRSSGLRATRVAVLARSWRRTGIQDLGVGILSLDHNRCRSPLDLFLLYAASR